MTWNGSALYSFVNVTIITVITYLSYNWRRTKIYSQNRFKAWSLTSVLLHFRYGLTLKDTPDIILATDIHSLFPQILCIKNTTTNIPNKTLSRNIRFRFKDKTNQSRNAIPILITVEQVKLFTRLWRMDIQTFMSRLSSKETVETVISFQDTDDHCSFWENVVISSH